MFPTSQNQFRPGRLSLCGRCGRTLASSSGGHQCGNGGLAGTRTLDQCLKRALLYQLSYQPNLLSQSQLRRLTNDCKHYVVTRTCNPSAFVLCFLHENDEQKRIAASRATSLSQGCREPLSARIIGRILCPIKARRQAVSPLA